MPNNFYQLFLFLILKKMINDLINIIKWYIINIRLEYIPIYDLEYF